MPNVGCARSALTASTGSSSSARRHLEHVFRVYRRPYNEHRPHRAFQLLPPEGCDPTPLKMPVRPHRRDLLGGLIHKYEAA
jgi:hypothetical protein